MFSINASLVNSTFPFVLAIYVLILVMHIY